VCPTSGVVLSDWVFRIEGGQVWPVLGQDRLVSTESPLEQGHPRFSHCQSVGRCRVSLRAEEAILAGKLIRASRMVAVVALTSFGWAVSVAAARVRLNAMTAQTSQAAFAQNFPDGMCARAEFFRSACTCSMIAC